MTLRATERIVSCCSNIENADSKEEVQKEVTEMKSCCSELKSEQAAEIQNCCINIKNAESEEEIRKETERIRSCCA